MHTISTKLFTSLTYFLSLLLLPGCSRYEPAFKGKALPRHNSPHKIFSKDRLANLTAYLENFMETTGMVVLYDGQVVYEYGDASNVSYNASVRKSILSMLYGKYIENGTINLNTTLSDMSIDDINPLLPIEKQATIHDILSARSGIFHEPVNGGYNKANALKRGTVKPGEYFLYNNWDYNVAGYIFEKYAGKSIYHELEEQLAKPLGFQDWNINNQKKMYSKYPAYHMYLSTRDMAKIGQLMLNKGEWEGKQLISKSWIEKSLEVITPVDTVNKRYGLTRTSNVQNSYSYMWWIFENFKGNPDFEGAYSARGWGGQYITIIPKRKLVISHMTDVSFLVKIGWADGGVSEPDYWNILDKLITGKIFLEELVETMGTYEIIEFIHKNKSNEMYGFSEEAINTYGYTFLNDGDYDDALAIFKLNTEMYPKQFNTYDSLGEALMIMGRKSEAISAYKKSYELNKNNINALNKINEMNKN